MTPHSSWTINGAWRKDVGTAYGTKFSFPDTYAGLNGNPVYISSGRAPAEWAGQAKVDCGQGITTSGYDLQVGIGGLIVPAQCYIKSTSGFFGVTGAAPSTVALQASGFNFSTSQGMPAMNVYSANLQSISQVSATSVSPDGTSATFPFPKKSDGTALPNGGYAFSLLNQSSPGQYTDVAAGAFSIGSNNTSMQTPYGVDAVDLTSAWQNCTFDGRDIVYCDAPMSLSTPSAIVTLSSMGQVVGTNGTMTVGSQPTAIKAYGDHWVSWSDPYGSYYDSHEPANAIVTNFGSNSVSILDLVNNVVIRNISVGTEPITVVLNSDQTKAYVANYGSSAVSEIDLNSQTQTLALSVGAQPSALAMDPSGGALWIGGLNYIYKMDLSSNSVVQAFSVSGQVTSVAVSFGQNALVYTLVTTSNGSTTFQAQQSSLATGSFQASYAQYSVPSSSSYLAANITQGGSIVPPGWLVSNSALVSVPYGNRYAVTGTPTGFVVIDLQTQQAFLQGTTSSAVRGIATDPANATIYITAPDSNSFLTVPFPSTQ